MQSGIPMQGINKIFKETASYKEKVYSEISRLDHDRYPHTLREMLHTRHLIPEFSSERIYPARQKSSYLTFRLKHIPSYASIAGAVVPKEP